MLNGLSGLKNKYKECEMKLTSGLMNKYKECEMKLTNGIKE